MKEVAKAAALRQEVKTPVSKGGKAATGAQACQHIIENGGLQAVWKGGPGEARDDHVKSGVVWPEGAEVKLLSGGGLEVMAGVALAQGLDKIVIELQTEVLGLMGQGIQDGGGKSTRAGPEFDHALSPPNLGHFGHALAQSG